MALTAVAVLALTLVGASTPAPVEPKLTIAVVTDSVDPSGSSFNELASKGLADAKHRLGVGGRVFISRSAADYVRHLSTASRQGYDLVIASSFAMADALARAAARSPSTKFAIVDSSWRSVKGMPANVRGLVFAEQEAGYLAGAAAALASRTGSVSSIGGQPIPAVVAFLAGFKAGARRTVTGTTVQTGYSETFTAQAACREIALNQIAAGSDGVFAVARGCGIGALRAAKDRGKWAIGVDTDQSFRGSHILTSVIKHADLAVYETIKDVRDGTFRGGGDSLFSIANGGVGFGEVSPGAPPTLLARLTSISAAIVVGKVTPPRR
jgi:basic membrane protein A